jgi:hypothetical protein
MARLLLALLLATCTVAEAKLPVNKMWSRRGCAMGSCQQGQGTGIPVRILDGRLIWTTAGHCLGDWNAIEIDGRKYESTIIARVPVNDLVPDEVVYLKTKDRVDPDSVSLWVPEPDVVPKRGDRVWLIGFPHGKYKRFAAEILTVDGDQFTVLPHANVGASGGAVFLQKNRALIGMIHAYYREGKQEGIMSRFDVVCDRLLRDGHKDLVARSRKADDGNPPGDSAGNSTPPNSVPGLSQTDVDRLIDAAIEKERRAREDDKRAREEEARAEAARRAAEARRRDAEAAAAAERQKAETERIRKELEGLRNRDRTPVPPPVKAPVVGLDPTPAEVIETPQTASEGLLGKIPWGLLGMAAGAAGIAIPGGALGVWGLKAGMGLLARRRRRKKAAPAPPLFRRDTTEAEQLLQLRAEERSPVNDAVFGMLWQDFVKANPDATVKEANTAVMSRFNEIAPLSTNQEPPK